MPEQRLQKIIAAAGLASRRKAEELIQAGLVSVNGQIVTELGSKADPERDSIRVNSKPLKGPERHEYIALNKPKGYVTTVSDPEGRPTVMELVRSKSRVYPIGRLDFNSEGLLLLTNDGELAHKLMQAASHIPKTYLVKVSGQPPEDHLRRLRTGISIAEERDPSRRVRTAPAQIRVIKEAENPWLEVTLYEGRNRQIRKMFEEIGHHVEKIRRVRYGPLELDLPPGESRALSPGEVSRLKYSLTAPQQLRPNGNRQSYRAQFPKREGRQERRGGPTGERRFQKPERPEFPNREDQNQERSGTRRFSRPFSSRRVEQEGEGADRTRPNRQGGYQKRRSAGGNFRKRSPEMADTQRESASSPRPRSDRGGWAKPKRRFSPDRPQQARHGETPPPGNRDRHSSRKRPPGASRPRRP